MNDLLIIFTRNPELGKCKTRLAATIGDQAALEIYKFLLEHTVGITQDVIASKQVYYSEEIWHNDIWDPKVYDKKLQQGEGLGTRMQRALEDGFKEGFDRVVIIGSDLFDMETEDIEMAFSALKTNDFVIGPAQDGGYYLLGMSRLKEALFRNKKWGTATVFQDTLTDLEGESVLLLPERNDVDVYEDIRDIDEFRKYLTHLD